MSDKDWDSAFNNDLDIEMRRKEIFPLWVVVLVSIIGLLLGIVGVISAVMSLCK